MKTSTRLAVLLLLTIPVACSGTASENNGERSEHTRESGEGHNREGEESGAELALNASYDRTRNGAHLTLAYDEASNCFVGKVRNETTETLEAVRVEVHLSNGRELGPTPADDLAPGAEREVRLAAESTGFTGWSAHPEVGRNEHGHGGEGGEHGGEHSGEHGGEGGEHGGKKREGRGEHR